MKKNETVIVMYGIFMFVGKLMQDEKTGKMTDLKDAIRFDIVHIPVPQANQLVIMTNFVGIELGDMNIPNDAIISTLPADSPMYQEYVRLRTGVEVHAHTPDNVKRIKH